MPGDEAYQATKPSKFFSRPSLGARRKNEALASRQPLMLRKEKVVQINRSLGSPRVSLHSANYLRPAVKLGQR